MTPSTVTIFGGVGIALGLAHFYGLRRDIRRYLARGMRGGVVAAHAIRLLATAAVLVFIARSGAIPLLVAVMGFFVTRFATVAHVARSA